MPFESSIVVRLPITSIQIFYLCLVAISDLTLYYFISYIHCRAKKGSVAQCAGNTEIIDFASDKKVVKIDVWSLCDELQLKSDPPPQNYIKMHEYRSSATAKQPDHVSRHFTDK